MKKQLKRILSAFLTVLMLAGAAAAAIPASAADYVGTKPSLLEQKLSQSDAEEYYIEDADDFVYFWHNRADFTSVVKLIADIDLNPGWTAKIDASKYSVDETGITNKFTISSQIKYTGTFDGQGHTVTGVYVTGTDSNEGAAIFGRCVGATIKNVKFVNCAAAASVRRVGGLVSVLGAVASKYTTISNVYADIAVVSTGAESGGLVGVMANSANAKLKIENTVYTGNIVTKGDTSVGGLVGYSWDNTTTVLENCGFFGSITAASDKVSGKLIGAVTAGNSPGGKASSKTYCTISNCVAAGTSNADTTNSGEVIGQIFFGTTVVSSATAMWLNVDVDNVVFTGNGEAYKYLNKSSVSNLESSSICKKNISFENVVKVQDTSALSGTGYDLSATWTMTGDGPMPTELLKALGENVPAESEADFIGYQVKAVDGGYNLRFIASGADMTYTSVGMSVSVTTEDGRTFSGSATTTKVYKTIIVGEEGGKDDYEAPDGKYVYTLVVGTFTDDLGVVDVSVTMFGTDADGKTVDTGTDTRTLDTSTLPELAGVQDPFVTLASGGSTKYKLYSKLNSTITSNFQTAFQNKTQVALTTTSASTDRRLIILGTGETFASIAGANILPTYSSYQIKVVGERIYVAVASSKFTSEQSALATKAINALFAAVELSDGKYTLDREFNAVGDTTGVTGAVPVYTGAGTLEKVYDSKNDGVISRQIGYTGATSASTSIDAYAETLVNKLGYILHDDHTINGNKFATYTNNEKDMIIHLNWFKSKGIFRIVYNTIEYLPAASMPKAGTDYTAVKTPTLSMLQLDPASPGGLSMVAQLEDGSFIVIDGGIKKDIHKTRLWNFLTENNKNTGHSKPIVTWIFTHNHGDHVNNAMDFLKTYGPRIDLKLVIMNYPDYSGGSRFSDDDKTRAEDLIKAINRYHSSTPIYVPHAGEQLFFPGLEIEIYFTQEEMSTTTNINNTSLVFKMKFGEGDNAKTCVVFGDSLSPATSYIYELYGAKLKSDIMQVPHHGAITSGEYSHYKALYAAVNPGICLWSTEKEKFGTTINGTYVCDSEEGHRMGCCELSKTNYKANLELRKNTSIKHYHHSQITTINMTNLSVSTTVVA